MIHEAMNKKVHSLATNEFFKALSKTGNISYLQFRGKGGYAFTSDTGIPRSFLNENP